MNSKRYARPQCQIIITSFCVCWFVCVCYERACVFCFHRSGERFWFLHLAMYFIPSYQRNYTVCQFHSSGIGSGGSNTAAENSRECGMNMKIGIMKPITVYANIWFWLSIALEILSSAIFRSNLPRWDKQTHAHSSMASSSKGNSKTKTIHPIGVTVETALHKQKRPHSNLR